MRHILLALCLCLPFTARAESVLRVGMAAADLGTLDPHRAVALQDTVVVAWIYDGLLRFRPGSANPADIEPDLATAWEVAPDSLAWTFHLRDGVVFSEGSRLTAEIAAASLRRAGDPKSSSFSSDYASVAAVEVLDATTLRIRLKQPVPHLAGVLAYHAGYIVGPALPAGAAVPGFAGTGPFMVSGYAPKQLLTLSGNARDFRGTPAITRIDYNYLPSDASRDAAYTTGEIDLIYGRQDQAWAQRIQQVPDTVLDRVGPNVLGLLHLNVTRKPLDDIRVRRAIAAAIDPSGIVAFKGKDIAALPVSILPVGYVGQDPDSRLKPPDLAAARALLAEAGHPDGIDLRMIQTSVPISLGPAQVVQGQLKRAGIRLDVDVVDHTTWQQRIRQDLSDTVNYSVSRLPIAGPYLEEFFHSRSTVGTPGAAANFSHCAVADAEIDAARAETDPARQVALWREATRKIMDAVCAVPLYEQTLVWAHRKRLNYGYALTGSLSYGPLITEQSRIE